jgi:opacity protein-like surface antigen
MNSKFLLSLAHLLTATFSTSFYVEGGVSHVWFGVKDRPVSILALHERSEDKTAGAIRVAGGAELTEHMGLELAYTRTGDYRATVQYYNLVGGDARVDTLRSDFTRNLDVVTLAPEFRWPLSATLSLSVSPQLNWIRTVEKVRNSSNNPTITYIPYYRRTQDDVTFGAAVGAAWRVSARWDVTLDYTYIDQKSDWYENAHLLTAGVRFRF